MPTSRFVAMGVFSLTVVAATAGLVDAQVPRLPLITSGSGSASSFSPSISANGRYVAFASNVAFDPADTNSVADVYVWDRYTKTRTLVSVSSSGAVGNGASSSPAISADGRLVAFISSATNLAAVTDTNGSTDVFIHDRQSGQTRILSVTPLGAAGNAASVQPAISGDGRHVAFASFATDLVTPDSNGSLSDVYVADVVTGAVQRVSVNGSGQQQAAGSSQHPALSSDGQFIVFDSTASLLCNSPNPLVCPPASVDSNGVSDVYLRDMQTGFVYRISIADDESQANGASSTPALSSDGRFVVFHSAATNILCGTQPAGCDPNNATDVFIRDRQAGTTRLVSRSYSGGTFPDGASVAARVSDDGRYVVFQSDASTILCSGICLVGQDRDTNGVTDVYLRDMADGWTVRISLNASGQQLAQPSTAPAIDAAGKAVSFDSLGAVVPVDANGLEDVYTSVPTPTIRAVEPTIGPLSGGTTLLVRGTELLDGAQIFVDGAPTISDKWLDAVRVTGITAPHAAGSVEVRVINPDGLQAVAANAFTYAALDPAATTDNDNDGIPDGWEVVFSLDPTVRDDGADPDGDGLTNAQEYAAGTNPRGSSVFTRYFAEGATIPPFRCRFAVFNPDPARPATAALRFLTRDGSVAKAWFSVPAHSRRTLDASTVPGLASAEFGTVVDADGVLAVDRLMTWDATGYGSHADTSTYPDTTWYLAEGATHSDFDLFYLIQNANDVAAQVEVKYLLPTPATPLTKTYTVGPKSRFNIWVNREDPALANTDVSAVITSLGGQPVIVERAMYKTQHGRLFDAGHESAGVTAMADAWVLAEGATGPYFDLFVLVANPNPSDVQLKVSYLLPSGQVIVKNRTVGANSRFNIWVDYEDPALANTAVSTVVESTGGGVIVERAMWWPGDESTWFEAHNSPGITAGGTRWAVAEGEVGGDSNAETYILIANLSGEAEGRARVTVYYEDGASEAHEYALPKSSRTNVAVKQFFPSSANQRFSTLIESLDTAGAAVDLAVEWALYSDSGGVHWAAGVNARATRLQ